MKSSLKEWVNVIIMVLFLAIVLTLAGFIEYWKYEAFIKSTQSNMSFWMWMLIFHK